MLASMLNSASAIHMYAILLTCVWMFAGCDRKKPEQPITSQPKISSPEGLSKTPVEATGKVPDRDPPIQFADMTSQSGVSFQWSGGPTSQHCMTEQNGGGIALFDFDNDALLDIVLTDCGVFDGSGSQTARAARLFRSQREFQFTEASQNAGLHEEASAMGVAAGDFNSDGFVDLFVACFGENLLYLNLGDGTFSNVTAEAGIQGSQWSTSAAFADLDGDGLLDLYVANYVDWGIDSPPCRNIGHPELLQICSPARFNAQPDLLYHNSGGLRFENISGPAGVSSPVEGKGLALDIADFSEDGLLDVFVANDTTRNSLFLNRSGLSFEDAGLSMGVAVSSNGTHGASMGTATGDFNRDGHFDLFVTNFRNQVNDLFSGIGEAGFTPAGSSVGISLLSHDRLAFGTVFRDFDRDGWQDLFVANGHIWNLKSVEPQIDYQMHPDLLRNVEGRAFENLSDSAGSYFEKKWLGRAVAAGDIDSDGMADLVIQHVGAPAAILKNTSPAESKAVLLTIIGTTHCRNPLGCRVTASSGTTSTVTCVPSGGSFQASHDSRVAVSIPKSGTIDRIEVVWPDASTNVWREIDVTMSRQVVLIEDAPNAFPLPD